MEIEPGIILVDKPEGISSFDVIRRLRRRLGIRKMGHAGTLDPLASGLMIIALEGATKKLSGYLKLPKSYEAEILLGVKTASGDRDGAILEECAVASPDEARVAAVLASLVGTLSIPVPAYSAIHVGGRRLYEMARAGEEVAPPIREMEVRAASLRGIRQEGEHAALAVTLDVGSGAYVRSIAEEIGRRLGVPASVIALRRITIGDHSVKDARTV